MVQGPNPNSSRNAPPSIGPANRSTDPHLVTLFRPRSELPRDLGVRNSRNAVDDRQSDVAVARFAKGLSEEDKVGLASRPERRLGLAEARRARRSDRSLEPVVIEQVEFARCLVFVEQIALARETGVAAQEYVTAAVEQLGGRGPAK